MTIKPLTITSGTWDGIYYFLNPDPKKIKSSNPLYKIIEAIDTAGGFGIDHLHLGIGIETTHTPYFRNLTVTANPPRYLVTGTLYNWLDNCRETHKLKEDREMYNLIYQLLEKHIPDLCKNHGKVAVGDGTFNVVEQ